MEQNKDQSGAAVRGEAVAAINILKEIISDDYLSDTNRARARSALEDFEKSPTKSLGELLMPRKEQDRILGRAADAPSEPSESLCAAVMNIPCARTMSHFVRVPEMVAYKEGHRDALCAVIDVIAAVKSRAADALDNQPSPVQPDYDALRRTIHELRTYSPAGDAYHGAHIHKVWADAIEAAICEPALVDAITRLDSQPTELPAEKRVVSVWDDLAFREAVLRVNEAVRADEDDPIEKHAEEVIEATRALAVYVDNQIDNATDSSQPTEPDGCAKCRHTYCMSGEVCKACGDVAMQGWKGGRQPTDGGVRNG